MKSPLYLLSILSLVLGAFTMNSALAGDVASHETKTGNIAVSFDDLNLADPSGLATMHRRVELAANKVCGVDHMKVSLDIVRKNRDCVSYSVNSASGKIDEASLMKQHQPKKFGLFGS